jgi:hypothetical protein
MEAPDQADIVGATLTRGTGGFNLRVSFAVWATLADDGWSGSYRFPDGAPGLTGSTGSRVRRRRSA